MKKHYKLAALIILPVLFAVVYSCKKQGEQKAAQEENLTYGNAVIVVDNTVQPIIEDALAVFQSIYDKAHIKQINKTETEILQAITKDSAGIIVMARTLTKSEEATFAAKKIVARVTPFATDAIAFIANKQSDSVLNLEEVYKVLRGKESATVKKLVFDNPNSSTVQYLLRQAGVKSVPSGNVYSLKTNEEVLKYVHDNAGAIGVIGLNWLEQPPVELTQTVAEIKVLSVDNVKIDKGVKKYYKPDQSNIATGSYPLTRKLYVLNYQGGVGLGMGFANYLSAPDGQRIILKSGLLPVTIPPRDIEVRSEL